MIRIHREGRGTLIVVALMCIFFIVGFYLIWPAGIVVGIILAIGFFVFILSFFRIPKRTFTASTSEIISPCDGKVVVIEEVVEPEFMERRCRQISIFMSPLNVHINWHPVSANVVYKKYHPGKYLVAWHPKSSVENERMSLGYELFDSTKILIRQIAGAVARRIVNYAEVNDHVDTAGEMGFIKFGSRVDVFIPLEFPIQVAIDDVVTGGVTAIASIEE